MAGTLNTTFLHSPFSQKYVSLIGIRATSYRSDERGMKKNHWPLGNVFQVHLTNIYLEHWL